MLHAGVSPLNLAPYGFHGLPNRAFKLRISSPSELLFFRRESQLLNLWLKTDISNHVVIIIEVPANRYCYYPPGTMLNS